MENTRLELRDIRGRRIYERLLYLNRRWISHTVPPEPETSPQSAGGVIARGTIAAYLPWEKEHRARGVRLYLIDLDTGSTLAEGAP